ncbi:hypothetical protein LF1_06230 [Rubripirellula obstinata]|uniref:Uncharacterized protein n=2 Tax=Rubripirellula obstinata TaxID=406547 RepID=A0A5B1CAE5_9BACT|nr:hypothetical protein LF1_06230 [Rubripirellula obstinata]
MRMKPLVLLASWTRWQSSAQGSDPLTKELRVFMSTFNLTRFTNIETLRSIAPVNLCNLLRPHTKYLETRGLKIPTDKRAESLDYDRLIEILRNPTQRMPATLVDQLYVLHEMSTQRAMDVLLLAANEEGVVIYSNEAMTPADFVFRVWMVNPTLVEKMHSRLVLRRRRRRDCFPSHGPDKQPVKPTAAAIKKMEQDFSAFYIENHRDRHCKVFTTYMDDKWEFTIAHGGLYDRIETVEGDDVTTKLLRPRLYATVALDLLNSELTMNTDMKRAKELFRFYFGKLLYDDPNRFPGSTKYSLAPLVELGVDALAVNSFPGIDNVVLQRVLIRPDGPGDPYEIKGAADLFEYLEASGQTLETQDEIAEAVLSVTFTDNRTPRSVSICQGNVASYTRDEDAVTLEAWMRERGFIVPRQKPKVATKNESLANV